MQGQPSGHINIGTSIIPTAAVGKSDIMEAVYAPVENDFEDVNEIGEVKEIKEETHDMPEQLSIPSANADLIRRSLEKHKGKRKEAAAELGISERTLYRKIKELGL